MRDGEFGSEVVGKGDHVAVLLTQGWCPQWRYFESQIRTMIDNGEPADRDIHLFEFVYDQVDFFHDFMRFKEKTFGNFSVPYIRYYNNGRLSDQSNYVTTQGFLGRFRES